MCSWLLSLLRLPCCCMSRPCATFDACLHTEAADAIHGTCETPCNPNSVGRVPIWKYYKTRCSTRLSFPFALQLSRSRTAQDRARHPAPSVPWFSDAWPYANLMTEPLTEQSSRPSAQLAGEGPRRQSRTPVCLCVSMSLPSARTLVAVRNGANLILLQAGPGIMPCPLLWSSSGLRTGTSTQCSRCRNGDDSKGNRRTGLQRRRG